MGNIVKKGCFVTGSSVYDIVKKFILHRVK